MSVIYFLVPITFVIVLIGLLGYLWSVKSGQFDDLDTPALRMMFEDDSEEEQD